MKKGAQQIAPGKTWQENAQNQLAQLSADRGDRGYALSIYDLDVPYPPVNVWDTYAVAIHIAATNLAGNGYSRQCLAIAPYKILPTGFTLGAVSFNVTHTLGGPDLVHFGLATLDASGYFCLLQGSRVSFTASLTEPIQLLPDIPLVADERYWLMWSAEALGWFGHGRAVNQGDRSMTLYTRTGAGPLPNKSHINEYASNLSPSLQIVGVDDSWWIPNVSWYSSELVNVLGLTP
jgi:hypothetical protein